MVRLLYYNIKKFPNEMIATYLRLLPDFFGKEVIRYKDDKDKKTRLIARLMLLQCLDDNNADLIYGWKRDSNNKPFIEGWDSFSISHSGDFVIFAHSRDKIGIDIEKKIIIDYGEVLQYFHENEQNYIRSAKKKRMLFMKFG